MIYTITDPTGKVAVCTLNADTLDVYIYSPTLGAGSPVFLSLSPSTTLAALMAIIASV